MTFIDMSHNVVSNIGSVGFFIRTLTGQGIIYIGNRNNQRITVDLFCGQSPRVSCAVEMFVMLGGNCRQYRWRGQAVLHGHNAPGTIERVFLDQVEFVFLEARVFSQNGDRNIDLSEIVQQGTKGQKY